MYLPLSYTFTLSTVNFGQPVNSTTRAVTARVVFIVPIFI